VQLYEALDRKDAAIQWTKEREAIEASTKLDNVLETASAAADRAIAAGRTQDALPHLVTLIKFEPAPAAPAPPKGK